MPRPAARTGATEPADNPWESVVAAIGPKVHALRQQRGLSLQQLAQAADVSAAAVHKVERGDMVPTITTLLKIANALGTPIGHFVDDDGPARPLAVRGRGLQPEPRGTGSSTLSGPAERFRTTATVVRMPPGKNRVSQPRPGEALLVVVHGQIDVTVADESYTLTAGESLHLPTQVGYAWANSGPDLAQVLCFAVPG